MNLLSASIFEYRKIRRAVNQQRYNSLPLQTINKNIYNGAGKTSKFPETIAKKNPP
jgi:hypothetical protein